jgi:RNA polymerase sigma-70 factor, ECF subfamily
MSSGSQFQQLYEEHASAVYRCLLAWSRNHALAEDLTAETFYRALASSKPIAAPTARAFFLTIARNLFRESLRRSWRQRPLNAAPEPAVSPDESLTLPRILEALANLPGHLREPLTLFAYGGLSANEIAAHLQLNPGLVRARIFRARRALNEALA